MSYLSFRTIQYDVIVVGAGYAGFAAAMAAQREGRRALLVDRRAALLRESGWSFATLAGDSTAPLWREWRQRLDRHRPPTAGGGDGAIAEVLATAWAQDARLPVLYHAAAAAAEPADDGLLAAVTFATKSGPLRLWARQWIDATDEGELATLLERAWRPPAPEARQLTLCFRCPTDARQPMLDLLPPAGLPDGARLRWAPGAWPGEQLLSIRLPGDAARPRQAWLPALRALHDALGDALRGAVLTHGSVVPWDLYPTTEHAAAADLLLPGNVGFAGANGTTLAEKFETGLRAAAGLGTRAAGRRRDPAALPPATAPVTRREQTADVVVAGLGTGGALAAIAAGRQGARVTAFETMPFAGGVGTGGGIHVYYFGVKGGLQDELDARVRSILPLFGTPGQIGGFHPDAKKLVLDAMLDEAGVQPCWNALLYTVRASRGRIESAMLAVPAGLERVTAAAWVDSTGDGDLSAAAGARYRLGRGGDGLLHAYGQSSGRAHVVDGVARLQIVNFDAGFCDPTDVQDLTRARIAGVLQYVQESYGPAARPTYIAPALGVRQSRHIETDYTLTLDDLIQRRRFADAISYTGCHYDNHARDYEFETDEAAFWVWVCQQWYGRLACEVPLRTLLPKDLINVVLACRALGVTEEAHHAVRMQRDMQRIGEAAGYLAALAASQGGAVRDVPFSDLTRRLAATGAIRIGDESDAAFGRSAGPEYFQADAGRVAGWLEELRGGPATEALWHLYRAGDAARDQILALLPSEDATLSWRAAALLAMWRDKRAEPRLFRAIRTREDDRARDITKPQQEWFYQPRWYAAVTLLKRCLTLRSIPVLEELAADAGLPLNVRNAVALAVEALAAGGTSTPPDRVRLAAVLEQLLLTDPPHGVRSPQGSPLGEVEPPPVPKPTDLHPVIEDYRWQLHLSVARARRALGLEPQPQARHFLDDERIIVRRAFARQFAGNEAVG